MTAAAWTRRGSKSPPSGKGLLTEAAASAMSDRDALGLIFASGFSTAAALSDISGRGVGMDIVKSNLEKSAGASWWKA